MKKIIIPTIIIIIIGYIASAIANKTINKKIDNWEKLSNQISYFKKENITRYKNYKKNNPNKNYNEIITNVNIGLDRPFYTNTKETINIDTPYTLVNKYNYLNKNYVPKNLEIIDNTKLVNYAASSFKELKKAAADENLNIVAISGYRSYTYQENLYNKYVKIDGIKKADTYSARSGYSEHQTGLAVDISNGTTPYSSFENTKEFNWMINNCYKYGFILRYPKDKENITGYTYESWHYRYVGIDIATYIQKNNITFDEYYVMFIDK